MRRASVRRRMGQGGLMGVEWGEERRREGGIESQIQN